MDVTSLPAMCYALNNHGDETGSDMLLCRIGRRLASSTRRQSIRNHSILCTIPATPAFTRRLGLVPSEWNDFVDFHVNVLGCRFCAANLSEMDSIVETEDGQPMCDRLYNSTVGFLTLRT